MDSMQTNEQATQCDNTVQVHCNFVASLLVHAHVHVAAAFTCSCWTAGTLSVLLTASCSASSLHLMLHLSMFVKKTRTRCNYDCYVCIECSTAAPHMHCRHCVVCVDLCCKNRLSDVHFTLPTECFNPNNSSEAG